MNVFWSDLITMIPEWNHFICMQIDNPRWPPGVVTKNSRSTKMTISQGPLIEIDPTLCQQFLVQAILIFLNGTIPN